MFNFLNSFMFLSVIVLITKEILEQNGEKIHRYGSTRILNSFIFLSVIVLNNYGTVLL